MKPKRILHIIGRMDRAGAETMLINLYRKLDKEKYQFDFLYFTNDKCHYDDEIIKLGGKIYKIPKEDLRNPFYRTYVLYTFLKSNNNFYAIHTHTLFNSGFNLIAAKFAGYKKRIVHSHNTNDINSQSLIGKIYQKFSRILINKFATVFVSCGTEAANFLYMKSKDIYFLPNAVDVSEFNNIIFDDFLRKEFKIEKKKTILIQIGRFSKVKNFDYTISIAKKLKSFNYPFHLFLVGDGVLKNKIEKKISSCALQKNITLLGVRSDISRLLKNSDLLLMPSLYEGFPVVLVESQASGIPALISDDISKEVDIGVNKIFFISLLQQDKWIKAIIDHKKLPDMKEQDRVITLRNKGFDINESLKILYEIYR